MLLKMLIKKPPEASVEMKDAENAANRKVLRPICVFDADAMRWKTLQKMRDPLHFLEST